jgi:hypothetical protein
MLVIPFVFRTGFAANNPYALILEVREDGFDPAQADPMLSKEAD